MKSDWLKAKEILMNDGVVVLPTDTLYGIIGRALSKKAVERIHKLKGRSANKPFIILINSYKQLKIFGVNLPLLRGSGQRPRGSVFKPKVSVILPCKLAKWKYLHRGTESIAFRMIGERNKSLFDLINKAGPLVAPSVNKEGDKPAETITEAKKYFGTGVDFYINAGRKVSPPSTLIKINDGEVKIIRQGAVKIKV